MRCAHNYRRLTRSLWWISSYKHLSGLRYALAQWVDALRYKPEGRGFHSRWGLWNFYCLQLSGRTMAMGSTQSLTGLPGICLGSKGGRCVRLTTLSISCADCLKILGAYLGLYRDSCNLMFRCPYTKLFEMNASSISTLLWNAVRAIERRKR